MKRSRRDLALLLPLLSAATARGAKPLLPSKTFKFEDLPVKENAQNKSRAVMNGSTNGCAMRSSVARKSAHSCSTTARSWY